MQRLILLLLFPMSVWAQNNCVLQEKTIKRTDVYISEIGDIRKDVIPWGNNQKQCIVNFKALVDNAWHPAHGEYIWDGEVPVDEACGIAVTRAKKDLTNSVKPSNIVSEDVLICRDDTNNSNLYVTKVGSFVDITHLGVHPKYPARFYYNGAECRWFVESNWTGKDMRQYQGIACKLEPEKWVVVDKF